MATKPSPLRTRPISNAPRESPSFGTCSIADMQDALSKVPSANGKYLMSAKTTFTGSFAAWLPFFLCHVSASRFLSTTNTIAPSLCQNEGRIECPQPNSTMLLFRKGLRERNAMAAEYSMYREAETPKQYNTALSPFTLML